MPNDLQTARYDGLMRRAGGLLGGGSKVTETLSELFPMMDMENLPAELLLLAGWRTAFTTQTVPATIGQTSRAQILNPVGSGRIAVVTDCWLTGAAGIVAYTTTDTLFANQFSGVPRDTRDGLVVNSGCSVAELVSGNTVRRGEINLQGGITFHHFSTENSLAVLAPGTAWEYGTVTDNLFLDVTFFWREREALSSELNFP